jgi:DNA polymerase I - 3''-5'' exonuclease and polymerase domains
MTVPQGRKGDLVKEVSNAIKASFIPDDGYILAEFDWTGIEALLVAYFADDPDYARICKIDIHSYNTSYGVGEPADAKWEDQRLKDHLASIKERFPNERADFKKAGLADNYGQGVYNMAKDLRCTNEKAQWYKDIIAAAAPKVAKWKMDTRLRAHSEGQLVNPFGYSLAFFEVFRPERADDGTLKWYLGKEASEALAYMPQSTGAAMLRTCLVELGNHPEEGTTFSLLVPTHDAILLQILPAHLDRIMHLVKTSMERKWSELGGLSVGTGAKVGPHLGAMKAWKPAA